MSSASTPTTRHVQHRFSILGGEATALAFADGAVWVASKPAGELRKIDPQTNEIVRKVFLKQGICCVAAGGGYVWAAVNPDATIWKLDRDGNTVCHDQASRSNREPRLRR